MAAVNEESIVWRNARKTAVQFGDKLRSFAGKTVVLTGATGLIGSQVARVLFATNDAEELGIHLVLPVRNPERAALLFGERDDACYLAWALGEEPAISSCDYFIHCACSTSSRDFSERPAGVLLDVVDGTAACLRAAQSTGCNSFVYLSTMEVYGEPAKKPASETDLGPVDPMEVRSSYPIGKLAAENLVVGFGAQTGMRVVVARLAQTFGAGVRGDDGRVFAEFARCAVADKDITLLSDGSKRNCYLSVDDAASGILTLAICGDASGAYNIANPETYCSISEMAEMVLSEFGTSEAKVTFGCDPARSKTFRKGDDILLDVSRMRSLGWEPEDGLVDMYADLIADWGE